MIQRESRLRVNRVHRGLGVVWNMKSGRVKGKRRLCRSLLRENRGLSNFQPIRMLIRSIEDRRVEGGNRVHGEFRTLNHVFIDFQCTDKFYKDKFYFFSALYSTHQGDTFPRNLMVLLKNDKNVF